jgi:PPOX class probable F420-dependent enzyme
MDIEPALAFAREHRRGVLATIRKNGRPQLSIIAYGVDDDGVIRVSITATRAKTANMRRDPRVSLEIAADDLWQYVVFEGDADLSDVSTEPGDATGQELADLYRSLAGEHPNWDEYFEAMVKDQRLVLRIRPIRAYGMVAG